MMRGQRRRTEGLRREEVATVCHLSTDYYARLERGVGPHPSEQMITAIAQGLHLSLDEREHLFHLAGHRPPVRGAASDFVAPGLLRILDRLGDTPAEVVTELGETLLQSPLGAALLGDAAQRTGPEGALGYRWFTDERRREAYPPEERERLSRVYASGLRQLVALRGPESKAARMAALLQDHAEFRRAWATFAVGLQPPEVKRLGFLTRSQERLEECLDPIRPSVFASGR